MHPRSADGIALSSGRHPSSASHPTAAHLHASVPMSLNDNANISDPGHGSSATINGSGNGSMTAGGAVAGTGMHMHMSDAVNVATMMVRFRFPTSPPSVGARTTKGSPLELLSTRIPIHQAMSTE